MNHKGCVSRRATAESDSLLSLSDGSIVDSIQ